MLWKKERLFHHVHVLQRGTIKFGQSVLLHDSWWPCEVICGFGISRLFPFLFSSLSFTGFLGFLGLHSASFWFFFLILSPLFLVFSLISCRFYPLSYSFSRSTCFFLSFFCFYLSFFLVPLIYCWLIISPFPSLTLAQKKGKKKNKDKKILRVNKALQPHTILFVTHGVSMLLRDRHNNNTAQILRYPYPPSFAWPLPPLPPLSPFACLAPPSLPTPFFPLLFLLLPLFLPLLFVRFLPLFLPLPSLRFFQFLASLVSTIHPTPF